MGRFLTYTDVVKLQVIIRLSGTMHMQSDTERLAGHSLRQVEAYQRPLSAAGTERLNIPRLMLCPRNSTICLHLNAERVFIKYLSLDVYQAMTHIERHVHRLCL